MTQTLYLISVFLTRTYLCGMLFVDQKTFGNSQCWWHYIFGLSYLYGHPVLVNRIPNERRKFLQIWHKINLQILQKLSLGVTDELIRIWCSKVKFTVSLYSLYPWYECDISGIPWGNFFTWGQGWWTDMHVNFCHQLSISMKPTARFELWLMHI